MNEFLEPPGSTSSIPSVRNVGIVYNLRQEVSEGPDDLFEEYDSFATIESLARELESLGFHPLFIEQNDHFLTTLSEMRPDLVFNLAEGRGNHRGRESQVPSVLESLDIPFTGSDSVALALSLDKFLTHQSLEAGGIAVPAMFCFRSDADLKDLDLPFLEHEALLVKPRWEGSSKGVFADSLVRTPDELASRVRRIWERYRQPALAESFLPGEEFTVGVIGNRQPRIAGMMRISCPAQKQGPFLYSLENKREWEGRMLYEGPDTIAAPLREALERSALQAFKVLELRDVSRIDFRLDSCGVPRVIDVNPLSGMSPAYSDLPILCRLSGGTYPDLVKAIVDEALQRNGLVVGSAVL